MTMFPQEQIAEAIQRMGKYAHLDALSCIPAYFSPQVCNDFSDKTGLPFKTAVCNIEQGTRLHALIPFFQNHPELNNVDILLANELDQGMARSQNADTPQLLAEALQMNYAFGVEFITTNAYKNGNTYGLHGNAIFSKYKLLNARIIHLPIQHEWFDMLNDSRLGTRIAIFAEIEPVPGKRVGLVCVHLENRAAPAGRLLQMEYLLNEVEAHFKGIPVLIGGDMNTNTVDGNASGGMDFFVQNEAEQWRRMEDIPSFEPLMEFAASRGYSYADCNLLRKSTRRKPMPGGHSILLNLDWFFQKGLTCTDPARVETIFHMASLPNAKEELSSLEGLEMTDHDAVTITTTL